MTAGKHFIPTSLIISFFCLSFLLWPIGMVAADTNLQDEKIEKIAVLPFLLGGSDSIKQRKLERTLDCQLRGLCYLEDDLQSDAGQILTDITQLELEKLFGNRVVPSSLTMQAYNSIKQKENKTPRELAVELGKKLRVDHVMVGLIWRFKQRIGSNMSVQSPASVAFTAFLVNVNGGELAWKATFDKTQASLSENLFDAGIFINQGMKWLTAEELATYGAEKIYKALQGK